MKRVLLVLAVLALCLPMVGETQSIEYKARGFSGTYSGTGKFTSVCVDDTNSEHCWARNSATTSVFNVGGSAYQALGQGGIINRVTLPICWSSGVPGNQACDTLLYRDAANTLALRNGTNAQTFNVYNTFTDASNNESLQLTWDSNIARVQTLSSGTGSSRSLYVLPKNALGLGDTSTARIFLLNSEFYPSVTDSVSLGRAAGDRFYKDVHVSRATLGSKTKALTEGAATTVATVAVPQTAGANFAAGEVRYTVYASDGTDTQTLNGSAFFSAVNKAGTETCQLTDDQIGTEAASAGTLVCTVACATGLTDVVGITFDCTSSLTQTSLNALVRFDMQQPNTLAFP